MNLGSILVVDDSAVNRTLLCKILNRAGYSAREAAGGTEALTLIEDEIPELVLLDVQMPGMNGYEVCKRIKANPQTQAIPVVFISALDELAEKVKSFEAGGVDFVTKPFEHAEVLARVGSQVTLYRLQREMQERNLELQRRNQQLVLAQQRTERVFVALSEALPGTVLDETYRLETRIGEGGFGAVYRGTHLRLERPVAIKILRPQASGDHSRDLARFKREGIAACRIAHPNAVEVLDFGVSSTGIPYLVMELLRGQTLSAMLKTEPIVPVARCAEIVVPVCDALLAAHKAGIVHRDVKPHNIILHMVADREVVKVVDFGIAKLMDQPFDGETTAAGHNTLVGTPEYMAPERLLARPYDERSDVYSVGVMLYLMISGEMPYARDVPPTMIEMIKLHKHAEPRHLSEVVRPNVPAAIVEIVMRMLDRDPDRRPTLPVVIGTLREAAARR